MDTGPAKGRFARVLRMWSRFSLWLGRRPKRWRHLDDVPVRELWLYLAAVFFLFSTIGPYANIMAHGRQSYAAVFTVGVFSGLNAALWVFVLARLTSFWVLVLCVYQIFTSTISTHLLSWVR